MESKEAGEGKGEERKDRRKADETKYKGDGRKEGNLIRPIFFGDLQ